MRRNFSETLGTTIFGGKRHQTVFARESRSSRAWARVWGFCLSVSVALLVIDAQAVSFFTNVTDWQARIPGNVMQDTLNDVGASVFPNPLYIERPQYDYKVGGAVTLDGFDFGLDPIWDVNGSSHYQNNVRAGFPADVVTYYFDRPVVGFAYTVRSAGLESFGSRIDIVTNDGQTGFFRLPVNTGAEFRGMVFPTPITALELRSNSQPYATHGADNIFIAPAVVPEPEAYGVAVVCGLIGLVVWRRKKTIRCGPEISASA